jgi:hypothetical protein
MFIKKQIKSMKKIFLFLMMCVLVTTCSKAQITASLRVGVGDKISNTFFAPSINFIAHHIAFGPEIIVQTSRDEPANFGLHLSYQVAFIEVGAARYFSLYSLDKYDENKNGWCNAAFMSLHFYNWFVQYQYMRGNNFSVGCSLNLSQNN